MAGKYEWLWVLLGSLAWFAVLTPWGQFPDPDAFYHAHVADLMLNQGPLLAFPWLDLTTVGQHFVDQHFLFHALLIPAIALARQILPGNPFAAFWGAQAMTPLLATGTAMTLWFVLKRLDPTRAWIWMTLALATPAFTQRLLLGKASPLALACFIAIIGLMVASTRWKKIALAMMGCLFALSHGGWIIAILVVGAIITGEILIRWLGENESLWKSIQRASWNELFCLCVGIAFGLLIHPNRAELFSFLWVQIVNAGIFSSGVLHQGQEWLPAAPIQLVGELALLLIPSMIAGWGMIITGIQRTTDSVVVTRLRRTILLALPVALTLALTLKSKRFAEYLVPALTIWTASLWASSDTSRWMHALREQQRSWFSWMKKAAPVFAIVLTIIVVGKNIQRIYDTLHRPGATDFSSYRNTFRIISERAAPGDRIFHSEWDEFPLLFAADDRLRYVSGLDPAFLHATNPSLSRAVINLTHGRATSTAWDVIVNQTGSRFVFITTGKHPGFEAALRADPRFQELARDAETAVYEAISN